MGRATNLGIPVIKGVLNRFGSEPFTLWWDLSYVSAWLRHAGQADDALFRLYTSILVLDLMGEYGHISNGNETQSTPAGEAALRLALEHNLKLARL